MLSFYKWLTMALSGLMCWMYFIFNIVLPYIAETNTDTTLAVLEAQALAFPIAGLLFEPVVMWIILLVVWILASIIAFKKAEMKKTTTTTMN